MPEDQTTPVPTTASPDSDLFATYEILVQLAALAPADDLPEYFAPAPAPLTFAYAK